MTTTSDTRHLWQHILQGQHKPSLISVTGCSRSDIELLYYLTAANVVAPKKILLLIEDEKEFTTWINFWSHILRQNKATHCASLPALRLWGSDRYVDQLPFLTQRLNALAALSSEQPAWVVATLHGLTQQTQDRKTFVSHSITFKKGDELDLSAFSLKLSDLGYLKRSLVENEGEYSVRGGLIDIFSHNYPQPLRVEFFGDTIASIRFFSIEHQTSKATLEKATVIPALECLWDKNTRERGAQKIYDALVAEDADATVREGLVRSCLEGRYFPEMHLFSSYFRLESECAWDYVTPDTLVIAATDLSLLQEKHNLWLKDTETQLVHDLSQKKVTLPVEKIYPPYPLNKIPVIELAHRAAQHPDFQLTPHHDTRQPAKSGSADFFDAWVNYLKNLCNEDKSVIILSEDLDAAKSIIPMLRHRKIPCSDTPMDLSQLLSAMSTLARGSCHTAKGQLSDSQWLEHGEVLIIDSKAFFKRKTTRASSAETNTKKLRQLLQSFRDLKAGSLVVHVDHGIGRYHGLVVLTIGGSEVQCLKLEYAGGDFVYVPVDRLGLLNKYQTSTPSSENHSEDGLRVTPTSALDKLKSTGWQRRKSQVKKAIRDMAEDLLKIHAKRAMSSAPQLHPSAESYRQFEADFTHIETDDQLRAIADVNHDLEGAKPMDRLVCGDVGFGKTEVALRAAFRAVLSGYQVMVLVPTTVLCYQHFRTFTERLSKHGVSVCQANRFVGGEEIKKNIDAFAHGKADILIGTHRILSKDINANKLGLLIIDEEQRFGVGHKEMLKRLSAGCHILTLTATPIPRTLHMAMIGLRDISVMTTPPQRRLAVRTYVSQWDKELIAQAIKDEVNRNGQVFIVHNRVEDILSFRSEVARIVPDIEIRVAHGQMGEHQLEKTILDFVEHKFSVLICTTIIESGVDMPNVNTLIVNNAHCFGLAQLYQLRGRVGRSNRQAYAYFIVPPEDRLTDESRMRLEVLCRHQALGSGFQIARYDLEIRGAGNLLGAEQSGQIAEVGLEIYTDMLEQAIAEIRGTTMSDAVDTEVKIGFTAIIPDSYISDERDRLDIYKRVFSATERSELTAMRQEIVDRFGSLVPTVDLLLRLGILKQLLRNSRVQLITCNHHNEAELKFAPLTPAQIQAVSYTVANDATRYRLTMDFKLMIAMKNRWGNDLDRQSKFMDELIANLEPF